MTVMVRDTVTYKVSESGGKLQTIIESRGFNAVVLAVLILSLLFKLKDLARELMNPDLSLYTWTDFYINYAGGFVRRGLSGEILQYVAMATGMLPEVIIGIFSVVCYAAVFWVLLRLFLHRGVKVWILLTPLMCGYTVDIIRKDYLLVLLLMLSVYLLTREGRFAAGWCVAVAVTLLALLIHEAYIFWGVPAVLMLIYSRCRCNVEGDGRGCENQDLKRSGICGEKGEKNGGGMGYFPLWGALVLFLGMFLLLSLFKGTPQARDAIYDFWNSRYGEGYLDGEIGNSIGAIGWDARELFRNHLYANFYRQAVGFLPVVWRIIYFILVLWLVANYIPLFCKGKMRMDSESATRDIMGVWMVLAVCLLPMFTILSCDYGRLYFYLFVTSFIVVLMVPPGQRIRMLPPLLGRFAGRASRWLTKGKLLTRYLAALAMLLLLAPSPHGVTVMAGVKNSVIGEIILSILSFC